jgi:hypothetical protein
MTQSNDAAEYRTNGPPVRQGQAAWTLAGKTSYAHADYPHVAGRLHDCPACEAPCSCEQDPNAAACVSRTGCVNACDWVAHDEAMEEHGFCPVCQ